MCGCARARERKPPFQDFLSGQTSNTAFNESNHTSPSATYVLKLLVPEVLGMQMPRQYQTRLVGIFTSDRAKGAVVMKFRPEIAKLVDEVIGEFGSYDLDPKDVGQDATEESHYLHTHRHEYIRTVQDIVDHAPVANGGRVLELGAFFSVVSICLARLGYTVTAADMPEFMELPEQIERFTNRMWASPACGCRIMF